jgi:hypothetical protein
MSDQGKRPREGFDVNDVSAYRRTIEKWRDDLRNIATRTLQMQGIEEGERYNLQRALDSLYSRLADGTITSSIDELVKIIGELPYAHAQAHALHQLWGAIGAAFVIGSRGIKNPLTEKFLRDSAAQARNAKPRIRDRDQIRKVISRHVAGCKNRKRAGIKSAIAAEILAGVNSDLAKLRIKPFKQDGLRKLIVLP